MSILTSTADDFAGPKGRVLPAGTYRVTIVDAKLEREDRQGNPLQGERLSRMYGNIRTPAGETELPLPDGTTFRIGNRKLFARSWLSHPNEKAQSIGQREIKQEAVSAGLLAKPAKGESTQLDVNDEYVATLLGRDVTVRVKQQPSFSNPEETEAVIAAWLE